jgi:hypothetical protein
MALADDIITGLTQEKTVAGGQSLLNLYSVRTLREVVDLMGIDAVGMSKLTAIKTILREHYGVTTLPDQDDNEFNSRIRWSDTQTNAGLAGTVPPEFAGN